MRGRAAIDNLSRNRYSVRPICRACSNPIFRGGHRTAKRGIVCEACDRRSCAEILQYYEAVYEADEPQKVSA